MIIFEIFVVKITYVKILVSRIILFDKIFNNEIIYYNYFIYVKIINNIMQTRFFFKIYFIFIYTIIDFIIINNLLCC